jgi:AcrR family transcriptional regulator
MPRVTKDPQERIAEIMDTAEEMFNTRGFQQTQISDIVKKVGVAQGTFYYYFKSKEEVLEAIVGRKITRISDEIDSLVKNSELKAPQKLVQLIKILFREINTEDGLLFEYLFTEQYLHILDRLGRQANEKMAPNFLLIIREGVEEGYFQVPYPEGATDFIIVVINFAVESLYKKEATEIIEWRFELAQKMLETALGAKPGTLNIRD